MNEIDRILEANAAHASNREKVHDARPSRRLAIVTCMDVRIDVLQVFGLKLGEAHVIRNAGGRVTEDVLRSLALSSHVLGVNTVAVVQHTRCGLENVTDEQLQAATGADLGFLPISDHRTELAGDIEVLTSTAYLQPIEVIAGLVYDVTSGEVHELVRWQRPGA